MKTKKTFHCYLCGDVATSKEHTPAKSFFPKEPAFRTNLITVPSCTKHNQDTSQDDEYVRNVIAMSIGNNHVAFRQFLDKAVKSFMRSPGLMQTTIKNPQRVYTNEKGVIAPTIAFETDRNRIEKVIKKIAYALFFHKHSQIWQRGLIVQTEYLRTEDMAADPLGQIIQQVKPQLGEFELVGTNPQVFKYIFMPTSSDDINDQILIMRFYEGFEVWINPITGSSSPDI